MSLGCHGCWRSEGKVVVFSSSPLASVLVVTGGSKQEAGSDI